MDILIHTLSGCAVGGLVANVVKTKPKKSLLFLLFGALSGAFPDIDAISAWSGFDRTIGAALGLENSGSQIYTAKFWYSHHAFTHSLLWCVIFGALTFLVAKWRKSPYAIAFALTACFGTLVHIFGDMPTPAGPWGGVALFFPSETYVGGWGKIWWWNNYDICLVLLLLNTGLAGLALFRSRSQALLAPVLTLFALGLIIRQINTRETSFSTQPLDNAYWNFEKDSKQIQRDILGPTLYNNMERLDSALPFYF